MHGRAANLIVVKCRAFLALVVVALAFPGVAAAGVRVWFVADEKPVPVARGGTTIEAAVAQLLAGPTPAERTRGIHSAIPRTTPLLSLTVARRIVTVDLGARFAAGRDQAALQARVGQLVRTVRSIRGVLAVRVLIEGGVPVGLFPGYDLRRPVAAAVEASRVLDRRRATFSSGSSISGFMASSGLTGNGRHADLDGRPRLPEVGEPQPGRNARRRPRSRRCFARPVPSPRCGPPAGGSRCSSGARSRF